MWGGGTQSALNSAVTELTFRMIVFIVYTCLLCSINTRGSWLAFERRLTPTQQQRPESPTITLIWHAGKYKVHQPHQRDILKKDDGDVWLNVLGLKRLSPILYHVLKVLKQICHLPLSLHSTRCTPPRPPLHIFLLLFLLYVHRDHKDCYNNNNK